MTSLLVRQVRLQGGLTTELIQGEKGETANPGEEEERYFSGQKERKKRHRRCFSLQVSIAAYKKGQDTRLSAREVTLGRFAVHRGGGLDAVGAQLSLSREQP